MADTPDGNTRNFGWAFGNRSKYAHLYHIDHGRVSGVPLCGSRCAPVIPLIHWNLDRYEIRQMTCPFCLARLAYLENCSLGQEPGDTGRQD